jgi:NAD(P)-dependent dehydrogenase (short-subunit alcohol dehydrogenase family)
MRLPDLDGHRALVTGSSSGIGLATASALIEQGCTVHGLDVGPAPTQLSHGYTHVRCDLREDTEIAAAVAEMMRGGAIDHVVNIAGIDPLVSLAEGGESHWDHIVDLDLKAYYLIIHHSLAGLRAGRGRSIVNVSSVNYRLGVPKRSIYAAAKAGILGLTRGLARELGAENIRINTVTPGWVFTERQREEYFVGDKAAKHLDYLHRVQSLSLHIDPSDIAWHILFYLSSITRASTGHNCVVDAGWLLE